MYHFARCQLHSKCPDLQGWCLILKPDDFDTLLELHKGVVSLYFHKFGLDPHITGSSPYNPIKLAQGWFQSAEKLLLIGTTLAVNSSGGMFPLEGVKVLSTLEKETMTWPDLYDDEVITISCWSGGRHYYLSSNKDRIFAPSKYVEYQAARQAAERYTDNIDDKEC
jgi:hypothetical protein